MEDLIKLILEEASKDIKFLRSLKVAAANCKLYELAAELRDLETEKFPVSEESNAVYDDTVTFASALRMVGISALPGDIYKILKAYEVFKQKGNKFSMRDASKIVVESDKIFGN